MRIAIVTTYPPSPGSLNEYAYHFVRWLREKPEIEAVSLLTDDLPAGLAYDADDGAALAAAPLRIVPAWRFGAVGNALRIRQAIRAVDPDVVLFNIQFATFGSGKVAASLGLTAPALVKGAGYPTIVLLHNIMETVDLKSAGFGGGALKEGIIRFSGTQVTRLLLSADWVALTIPKYVELLEHKYHAKNVLLAPHGAFSEAAPPVDDLPPGPPQIMTFGKFGTYKRVDRLTEAFRILQARNGRAIELVIAGTDSPNAPGYLARIAEQCADMPNVRFTGYVAEEDVPRIFREAAVVVFPYTSTTGSSGVLHQAGEYGKAVALPRIGDLAEVIAEEGYTGEFFEPDDAVSLADAIARVLDNPQRRREIGMQNYLAAHGLPMSEVVDWYVLHFQALLRQRGAGRQTT